jgi:hypothetical protein
MSIITVELGGQHIEFEITYYSPALPATRWEPAEPEELEWVAVDPAIQALIDHFGLYEPVEELISEQAKRDRDDADDYS